MGSPSTQNTQPRNNDSSKNEINDLVQDSMDVICSESVNKDMAILH